MVKVSVIVAVYQVEQYIVRCLDSLLNQTFRDFEVLLIDDGSVDSSGQICDEYANKDNRFKVFHKKNEGVGATRQFGIEKSVGEYIIHVDPDDWIEPSMLEDLYSAAQKENADLVICDYYNDENNKSVYIKQEPDLSTKDGYFLGLINDSLFGACWNKLVKRNYFVNNNISFLKNMVLWEDKLVNLKLADKIKKITYVPRAFYHYTVRDGSAVRVHSVERVYSIINYIDWIEKKSHFQNREKIIKLKKFAKRDAFMTKNINFFEFKNIFPEVNNEFSFKISDIGRSVDFYIAMTLKYSFPFFRCVFFLRIVLQKKIKKCF